MWNGSKGRFGDKGERGVTSGGNRGDKRGG